MEPKFFYARLDRSRTFRSRPLATAITGPRGCCGFHSRANFAPLVGPVGRSDLSAARRIKVDRRATAGNPVARIEKPCLSSRLAQGFVRTRSRRPLRNRPDNLQLGRPADSGRCEVGTSTCNDRANLCSFAVALGSVSGCGSANRCPESLAGNNFRKLGR